MIKSNRHIVCSLLICYLIMGVGFSQTSETPAVSDVMKSLLERYTIKESFTVHMNYMVYGSEEEKNSTLAFTSTYSKHKSDYYLKIKDTEYIKKGEETVKVNHQEKAIQYVENNVLKTPDTPLDFTGVILSFNKAKVTKEFGMYRCVFYDPKPQETYYKKIVYWVDTNDFSLKSQELYFNKIKKYQKGEEVRSGKPLMVITFETKKLTRSIPHVSRYITKQGTQIKSRLKGYEII